MKGNMLKIPKIDFKKIKLNSGSKGSTVEQSTHYQTGNV